MKVHVSGYLVHQYVIIATGRHLICGYIGLIAVTSTIMENRAVHW